MDDVRVERVLRAVECVPEGRAATYGLIGRITGERPRVVGWVMHAWGADQCWWRIVNAQGTIAGHAARALPHWLAEGLLRPGQAESAERGTLEPSGAVVDLPRVAMAEEELRQLWTRRTRDLPPVRR